MNKLKNINKGLILFLIIVVIIIIYSCFIEKSRAEDKYEIKSLCQDYMNFEAEATMLEKEDRKIDIEVDYEEIFNTTYVVQHYIDYKYSKDEEVIKRLSQDIMSKFEKQLNGIYMFLDKKRDIVKVNSYDFKEDTVTVEITSLLQIDIDYRENYVYNKEIEKMEGLVQNQKISKKVTDVIILKKINNQWTIKAAKLTEI